MERKRPVSLFINKTKDYRRKSSNLKHKELPANNKSPSGKSVSKTEANKPATKAQNLIDFYLDTVAPSLCNGDLLKPIQGDLCDSMSTISLLSSGSYSDADTIEKPIPTAVDAEIEKPATTPVTPILREVKIEKKSSFEKISDYFNRPVTSNGISRCPYSLITCKPATVIFNFIKGGVYVQQLRITNTTLDAVYVKILRPDTKIKLTFMNYSALHSKRIPAGLSFNLGLMFDGTDYKESFKTKLLVIASKKQHVRLSQVCHVNVEFNIVKPKAAKPVKKNPRNTTSKKEKEKVVVIMPPNVLTKPPCKQPNVTLY